MRVRRSHWTVSDIVFAGSEEDGDLPKNIYEYSKRKSLHKLLVAVELHNPDKLIRAGIKLEYSYSVRYAHHSKRLGYANVGIEQWDTS